MPRAGSGRRDRGHAVISAQSPVSAIVVSYRTGPMLWACLDRAFDAPEIGEVIVVDNGNPPEVSARLRALAARRGDVRLVQGQGNVGFARACNLGAAQARGEALLFLNPDLLLAPGAVRALLDAAKEAKAPCIIGGLIIGPDGREQKGARRLRVTPWRAFVSFSGLARFENASRLFTDLHRRREPVPEAAAPMPVVSGALMLIPRASFDLLSGFDTRYFLHVEDIDICRRAEKLGGGAIFQPRARADHASATSDAPAAFVEWHKARGFQRYFRGEAEGIGARIMAELAGAALLVLLPARAWLLSARSGR